MIRTSPRIIGAVDAFSESLGLTPQPASDGSVSFVLSRSGILSFTPSEDGEHLLVSLAQNLEGPQAENEWRFFARAGFDPVMNKFLHSGLSTDESLVHVIEFSEKEVDLPTLSLAAQRLIEVSEE